MAAVMAALRKHGFHVVRSFDLASALDPADPTCSCPHHGTEQCTCRYAVLLVYGNTGRVTQGDGHPCAMAIHTQGAETFITVYPLEEMARGVKSGPIGFEHALLRGLAEASIAVPPVSLSEEGL